MSVDLLKHNEESYKKIVEIFKTDNRTCVIQPTGSGKSFLILKLIEDYITLNRDIIIIEPQKYIFNQLKEKMDKYGLLGDNVKFITYSALGKMDDEKLKGYNLPAIVMVDEMHRAGAKTWESGLRKMFDIFPDDCKYVGFSATPIRFLDGKRDMCKELFNGCVANEIGLADAILNRILPLPRYIAGLYSYSNIVSAINKKICQSCNSEEEKKELIEEVKTMKNNLDKSTGISDIFKKYINQDKGKFIAFLKNIDHLKQMKSCLEKWFTEAGISVNFYEVHCKNPEKDDQFNAFMADDRLAVCLSVVMLSEGVHGIDGVILLRDLMSPNLYYQQIGRVFSVDMKTIPIIFDLMVNCEAIMDYSLKGDLMEAIDKREREKQNSGENSINENSTEITKDDIERFFIFDQVLDAINVFKNIEKRLINNWENGLRHFDKYVSEHKGDVLVPLKYRDKDGFLLGSWVSHNRSDFKNKELPIDKINILNKKGFVWDVLQYNFEKNIKALKQYKEREGDCLVPGNHIEVVNDVSVNLGIWCSDIRSSVKKNKRKLTKDMENQLNQLGFIWNVYKYNYNNALEALKQYRDREGDCLVPGDHVEIIKNGISINLGVWVKNIRKAKKGRDGLLLPEQIEELEELDFVFDQYKYSFKKQVIDVKNFILLNGNYPKFSFSDKSETKLARFVLTERGNKKKAEKNKVCYPQWKINIIENEQLYDFFAEKESSFDRFYRMALVYKGRFGHMNIKFNDVIDGYNIGMIYQSLITNCKNGKMTDVEIKKLKAIDIDITMRKYEKQFEMTMDLARKAVSEGIVIAKNNKFFNDVNLYDWYQTHKSKFKDEELEIMNTLIPNNHTRKVAIINIKDGDVHTYLSIKEAGKALYNNFHAVKCEQQGINAINNILYGRTKNPIYKGRFRFEYTDTKTSIQKNPT